MALNWTGSDVKLAALTERVLSIFLSYVIYGIKKFKRGNVVVHCNWIISNFDYEWELAGFIFYMIRYDILSMSYD